MPEHPVTLGPRSLPKLARGALLGRLCTDCAEEWHAYTHHPFVQALADGSLDQASFRRFLVQDYLYLIQYARAYALAITKDPEVNGMRNTARLLSDLLDTELTLHVNYCRGWGLDEEDLARAPESIELLAYSRFILDCGQRGDILDLMVALAACLVGYAEIGLRLAADPATKQQGNPYAEWMSVYGGGHYVGLAQDGIQRLDALARSHGADSRYPMLLRQFKTTVQLETAFWTAGSGPRPDLPFVPCT